MITAASLISRNQGFRCLEYAEEYGVCTFCGTAEYGKSSDDVINHKYFSDYDLAADTGHVCAPCAMCMSEGREFKNGSWLATPDEYLSFSTGDIKQVVHDVTDGEYETPLALHVAESPMRSEHAYLWTPVSHSTDPVLLDFSRQTVRVEQETFFDLIDAVETLRGHGFRLDDLRNDNARIRDIKSVGREQYHRSNNEIEPYRQTALFELVLKASEKP